VKYRERSLNARVWQPEASQLTTSRVLGNDVGRGLRAPHHGHLQVADDNVKVERCLGLHGQLAILGLGDGSDTQASQLPLQHSKVHGHVVHNECRNACTVTVVTV
jgi:hypothetical protein